MTKISPSGAGPKVGRPHVPGYGIPKTKKGTLPWTHASERLERSRHYWVATTGSDGRPHAVPVWGVWVGGAVCFGGGPQTRWARNLSSNPAVSIHLEKGDDVVILEGSVERVTDPKHELVERIRDAYESKYEMRHPPPFWLLRPRIAFAWDKDLRTATRFVFL
jgi:Pyridoxamine 5'-phosphate oxidase